MKMGDTIRLLREQKNLTQEELGALIGVKKAAIQKYESGKVENIKKKNIKILADFFGVTPSYLLGYQIENAPGLEEPEADIDKQLFNVIQALTDEQKRALLTLIDSLET